MAPFFKLPVASTIVQHEKQLCLISPIAFSETQIAEIRALGDVVQLIAPNSFHHLSFPKAQAHWPSAKTWATLALMRKRKDIRFEAVLDERSLIPGLMPIVFEGAPLPSEVLLFHHHSKSLIVTDLLFNTAAREVGFLGSVYLMLTGMNGKAKASPVWRWFVKDKTAARRSLHRLLELDFERIVPAHGAVVESGAKAVLQSAWKSFL